MGKKVLVLTLLACMLAASGRSNPIGMDNNRAPYLFQDCMSGPKPHDGIYWPIPTLCQAHNLDGDNDIDLFDWAEKIIDRPGG